MKISPELRIFQKFPSMYEAVVGKLLATAPATGTFIDGGAHVGDHTANMLTNQHVQRLFAIEAIPRLCDRLVNRFQAEPRVTVIKSAIGKSQGTATFHVAENAPGYSGLKSRTVEAVTTWTEIPVNVMPLDELIPADAHQSVRVIKLDLEGGEFDAMRGATEVLAKGAPLIIFENGLRNSAQVYGYTRQDFFSLLKSVNYEVFDFFGNTVDEAYWEFPLQTYMFVASKSGAPITEWARGASASLVSTLSSSQSK